MMEEKEKKELIMEEEEEEEGGREGKELDWWRHLLPMPTTALIDSDYFRGRLIPLGR